MQEQRTVDDFQIVAPAAGNAPVCWPPRFNLIGVPVSCTSYGEAVRCILAAAQEGRPALVTAFAAHGVTLASKDAEFRQRIRDFALVAPDGQAVRLAVNLLYRAGMRERVCGPELMPRVCQSAAERGIGVYLYGSTTGTVTALRDALVGAYPGLRVVGCEPSVFRPLTTEEDRGLVERINRTGAGIVFIGLGCPLQENFAHAHRHSIQAVQICVGAGFDFIAGAKLRAPRWMQDHTMEWLFRLSQEPRRLWKRNAVYSPRSVARVALQAAGLRYETNSNLVAMARQR